MKNLLAAILLVVGVNCYAATDSTKVEIIFTPNADAYYPTFSKRNGEQGSVICQIEFNEQGIVEKTSIVESSKYWRLDNAATEICKRLQIKPFIVKDSPVKIRFNYGIAFKLKD